jgi:hypothetical protein
MNGIHERSLGVRVLPAAFVLALACLAALTQPDSNVTQGQVTISGYGQQDFKQKDTGENIMAGEGSMTDCRFVGMWVTADGTIRHELLVNGRYDEQHGSRGSAYQGDYRISGNHIDYRDDTGFTADGDFVDGVLYHAGMVLFREE